MHTPLSQCHAWLGLALHNTGQRAKHTDTVYTELDAGGRQAGEARSEKGRRVGGRDGVREEGGSKGVVGEGGNKWREGGRDRGRQGESKGGKGGIDDARQADSVSGGREG